MSCRCCSPSLKRVVLRLRSDITVMMYPNHIHFTRNSYISTKQPSPKCKLGWKMPVFYNPKTRMKGLRDESGRSCLFYRVTRHKNTVIYQICRWMVPVTPVLALVKSGARSIVSVQNRKRNQTATCVTISWRMLYYKTGFGNQL